jgi:predicted transcriptional regulator YdeE
MEKLQPARYEDGRPMLLGGLRRHHAFAESGRGIPEQWRQFEPLLGRIPGQVGTTTYGAMCGSDASGFEYMCAVEVESFSALPGDLGRMRIAEQHYAVFLHRGNVSAIQGTWGRILNEWLPNCGYRSANKPDFEVYDQRFDPRTGLGDVEIWISIVQGEGT